jgi:hypothetical protein
MPSVFALLDAGVFGLVCSLTPNWFSETQCMDSTNLQVGWLAWTLPTCWWVG